MEGVQCIVCDVPLNNFEELMNHIEIYHASNRLGKVDDERASNLLNDLIGFFEDLRSSGAEKEKKKKMA